MRTLRLFTVFCAILLLTTISIAQDSDVIYVTASWTGTEQEGFEAILDIFTEETGIEVIYEPDANLVDNVTKSAFLENPTSVAFLPRPGVIRELANNLNIVPLDDPADPILEPNLLNQTLSDTFIELGTVNGSVFGVMVTSRSKSTIWYDINTFEENDLSTPTSWTELLDIADTLVAEGITPFSLGGGDGWTLSDWFENIFIRLHGPQDYADLFTNRTISWNDPRVSETFRIMAEMLLPYDEKLANAEDSILQIGHRDAVRSWLEGDAPMYYEGGFVRSYAEEIFPDLVCSEDFSFFTFPQIDLRFGKPIVGGGQLAVVFEDTPEVREFMNFIASPEAATAWVTVETGGIISPNLGVALDDYTNPCAQLEAQQIRNASSFVFDGSDLMPGIFGEFAFFVALQDFLIDPDALGNILDYLNDAASKSA